MEKLVTTYHWLSLSSEERVLLREIFGIPRSSGTVMQDNKLTSDGHTMQDLKAINVSSMQHYLGEKEEDFDLLFSATVNKMRGTLQDRRDEEENAKAAVASEEAKAKLAGAVSSLVSSIKLLSVEGQLEIKREIDAMLVGIADEPKKKNAKDKKAE